jgi:toxin YhaV
MLKHPERITSLSASRVGEAVTLTEGVSVSDDDSLPDDVSLHPAFRTSFDKLVAEVTELKQAALERYTSHPKTNLLKRLLDVILIEVPRDPSASEYSLGNTLGLAHRHWRRAKFLGRFRLFFRYSSAQKTIIYAWVNDDTTLRKAGARTDPYAVFTQRLKTGCPPDDWDDLIKDCMADNTAQKPNEAL